MAPQPDPGPQDEVRAHRLAQELAEFSERAGHDLLGPLNQASSLVALFAHRHRAGPDADAVAAEANVLLDFLQTSAARMQRVIAGVQPFLKIAATSPRFESVDLNAALAAARLSLEGPISESCAAIAHEALPVITANGDQMTTLFEILIGNAIKFRGPAEPPCIRISAKRAGEDWIFVVADNGLGIDAEYRDSVFLPFRRLHGKEYPGAGMGLATAKLIVGLHGGEIRIEPASQEVRGTVVLFTVPALYSVAGR